MQDGPHEMPGEHRPASGRAGQAAPQPKRCRDEGHRTLRFKSCQAGAWAAGPETRAAQEDTAAQQHLGRAPSLADLNILAGKGGGRRNSSLGSMHRHWFSAGLAGAYAGRLKRGAAHSWGR